MLKTLESPAQELVMSSLTPHPENPRTDWDDGEFEELMRSIEQNGVTNMPVVRPHEGAYQIISGHRRIAACQELGMSSLMCIVRECGDEEALILLMTENMHRADLNAIEEGSGFALLCERLKISESDLAKQLGCTETRVKLKQELLRLPEASQESVRCGVMDIGVAQLLLNLPEQVFGEGVELVQDKLDLDEGLTPTQAQDLLRYQVLEPYERRQKWESSVEEYKRKWGLSLQAVSKMGLDDPLLRSGAWDEVLKSCYRDADHPVPSIDRSEDAPENLFWLHLAQRHNVPISIIPGGESGHAVVNVNVLIEAETAIYEGRLRGEEMLRGDLSPSMRAEAEELAKLRCWLAVKGAKSQAVSAVESEVDEMEESARYEEAHESKPEDEVESSDEGLETLDEWVAGLVESGSKVTPYEWVTLTDERMGDLLPKHMHIKTLHAVIAAWGKERE